MVEFILICVVFLSILFVSYFPAIIQSFKAKHSERILENNLISMQLLYDKCVVVYTNLLGLGESHNSDVKFVKAHQNQEAAVDSIIALMDTM